MTPTLLFAAALSLAPAAPVPKSTPPSGPAPYLMTLAPAKDGKVTLVVLRTEKESITVIETTTGENGTRIAVPAIKEVDVIRSVRIDLLDVRELRVVTAAGTPVEVKAAATKLVEGGTVLVSADGKKVDPAFLALFKDDTLVFASPELVPSKTPVPPARTETVIFPPDLEVKPGNPPPLRLLPGSETK